MATDVNWGRALRADAQAMAGMLDALGQINEQLLDAMVASAALNDSRCPLLGPLRAVILALTPAERARVARCGVLLGDVGLADIEIELPETAAIEPSSSAMRYSHWLPADQAITLTHSILLVGWHVMQMSPALACVALGMSARSAQVYSRFSVRDLARLAQHPACWVQPRWHNRPQFWTGLMQLAHAKPTPRICSLTVRCLQLTAGMVVT
jgi:hypothetical protein